jgi:predicted helicase
MMLSLKPNHKVINEYYNAIHSLQSKKVSRHEGAITHCFANLLRHCTTQTPQLTLIEQYSIKRDARHPLRADGALVDKQTNVLLYGIWEAKDAEDNLEKEIKNKFKDGYPKDNILFQSPEKIILYQNGERLFDKSIVDNRDNLIQGLNSFFSYNPPVYEQWEDAVHSFRDTVGELGFSLVTIINKELKINRVFQAAFENFSALCRYIINPNIAQAAIIEMLVQHLMTERVFRTVFNNSDFVSKNVIAKEIEKVIHALTSRAFSRDDFLKSLDRFYIAIEETAKTIHSYSRKQDFLNAVYESFFQGFAVKVADTHGIVYTPQPIVDFMVNSVQEILKREFNQELSSRGVSVLDPFTGTGNFIMRVMQEIKPADLTYKYKHELHCNEIMLLPYYIASMNIEHAYYERTKQYEPFSTICLVDTFELFEPKQAMLGFDVPENTERVNAQKVAPIFVIIGNPPYNVGQQNENDNNKNRKYPHLDGVIEQNYAKTSKATNKNKLSDAYIKSFAWATERLQGQTNGIIAFVTNNGFLDGIATDGMRKHLGNEFDKIYIFDLGGNSRKTDDDLGNVFGIRVGVAITILVKNGKNSSEIYYTRVMKNTRKSEKLTYLNTTQHIFNLDLQQVIPDSKNNWLTEGLESDFETFTPMGSKEGKATENQTQNMLFRNYGLGIATSRDAWAYNFNADELTQNMQLTIDSYNEHVSKYSRLVEKPVIDHFVVYDDKKLSWSESLKANLKRAKYAEFQVENVRNSMYRPFSKKYLYFDRMFNARVYQFPSIFPTSETEQENRVICVAGIGDRKGFGCLITNLIPSLDLAFEKAQCFPFYIYSEDGNHRQENLTDWALKDYQSHYADENISKWDIFYYVYGLLHHQGYRNKYAANLKRELPRIPKLKEFWKVSHAGKKLAELHLNYENQAKYPLEEQIQSRFDFIELYRVEKMRFNKEKTAIIYNDMLTLSGIPPEALEYKLGNRSALDWIIDQYQISTDKRSGITNDPNNIDDQRYIVELIMKIVTVSVETVGLVREISGCELIELPTR